MSIVIPPSYKLLQAVHEQNQAAAMRLTYVESGSETPLVIHALLTSKTIVNSNFGANYSAEQISNINHGLGSSNTTTIDGETVALYNEVPYLAEITMAELISVDGDVMIVRDYEDAPIVVDQEPFNIKLAMRF